MAFSLFVSDPTRRGPEANPLAETTHTNYRQFLRPDGELRALTGPAWLEEPRFAPDGGADLERWSRPQDDGPALRAAGVLRVAETLPHLFDDAAMRLVRRDLQHVGAVAGRPCIGPWEEEEACRSTFTLIAEWDALDRGAAWLAERGEKGEADALVASAASVAALAEAAVDGDVWRQSVEAPPGTVDSATILALLHADRREGKFALDAPRTLGTVVALERLFAMHYPLNRGREVPAMGRWRDDVFFGGNPWFPVTMGLAELHYRLACLTGEAAALHKAEAWMALVEDVAPPGDALPEQFDRATGEPVSCRALTWSAAAFIGAVAARDAALQAMASR